ncbi:MAG: Flp pilus assembly protein CpaB [Hyphomonas sp.]|uniref:Flp pilus assembly protein CpaB n=1 Tax=Hyphomonas sp. TaxID=87 RepID=UPI0032999F56
MKLAPLISLGLSAGLGIAAVFLGRYYMSSNSTDAAAQMSAPVVQMSSVVVAAAAIEPGEEVSASNVKTLNWPTESIPEGVVTDAAELSDILYARGLILPGEPIMFEKLDAAGNLLTLAAAIEPGMRAVSITVRSDTGVAGFVLPGDRVDVNEFIQREPGQSANSYGGDAVRVTADLIARPVLKNVKVLAVDQTFESNLEGARPSSTVTLEVSPEGALRLGAVGMQGALGLALIGREEEADVITLVKSEPKRAPIRRIAPPRPSTANVRVINGDRETTVTAPVAKPKSLTEEAN